MVCPQRPTRSCRARRGLVPQELPRDSDFPRAKSLLCRVKSSQEPSPTETWTMARLVCPQRPTRSCRARRGLVPQELPWDSDFPRAKSLLCRVKSSQEASPTEKWTMARLVCPQRTTTSCRARRGLVPQELPRDSDFPRAKSLLCRVKSSQEPSPTETWTMARLVCPQRPTTSWRARRGLVPQELPRDSDFPRAKSLLCRVKSSQEASPTETWTMARLVCPQRPTRSCRARRGLVPQELPRDSDFPRAKSLLCRVKSSKEASPTETWMMARLVCPQRPTTSCRARRGLVPKELPRDSDFPRAKSLLCRIKSSQEPSPTETWTMARLVCPQRPTTSCRARRGLVPKELPRDSDFPRAKSLVCRVKSSQEPNPTETWMMARLVCPQRPTTSCRARRGAPSRSPTRTPRAT